MEINMDEETFIEKDWLTVKNYEFKILVMIAVLAENHLAYRGKIKDMCQFLGVNNTTSNTSKIKEAISALEAKGDIKTIKDGWTWTLTLSVKAEKKQKIIRIKNAWIKAIQNYKSKDKNDYVSWENVLKVLVYLCGDKKEIKRYDEIAKGLNISENAVKRSIKALDGIDFKDISIKRKLAWLKQDEDFKVIGQHIDVVLDFND